MSHKPYGSLEEHKGILAHACRMKAVYHVVSRDLVNGLPGSDKPSAVVSAARSQASGA